MVAGKTAPGYSRRLNVEVYGQYLALPLKEVLDVCFQREESAKLVEVVTDAN